jgi:hypothetical protein
MALSGYSGTPLAKKLSLKDGMRTWWDEMPPSVRREIEAYGLVLTHLLWPETPIDAAHIFVTDRAEMEADIGRILPHLAPTGFIWVSWPKQAARVPTDINEDVIREVALPTGLVDVKVCAIDETWSGLKLMIRKENRDPPELG